MNNLQRRVQRLQKITRLLDTQFTGPFGLKFGFDPLIGLIPVFGDAFTTLISFYIVLEAHHLGCGPTVLVRMILNIFFEDLVKVVPLVGQLFDFYWKSNVKNMQLLEKYLDQPAKTERNSALLLGVLILSFLLVMTFVLASTIYLIVALVQMIKS